jgi:hypothetical protein
MSLLLTLFACGNPCQQLCGELYAYAKECGHDPTQDELQACKQSFADVDEATWATCRDNNDPDYVREWWSCEDLAENWTNVAP